MLSLLATDYFRRSPLMILPIVALAIFMLVFFVVTVRTLLTKKRCYDSLARLPLESEADRG